MRAITTRLGVLALAAALTVTAHAQGLSVELTVLNPENGFGAVEVVSGDSVEVQYDVTDLGNVTHKNDSIRVRRQDNGEVVKKKKRGSLLQGTVSLSTKKANAIGTLIVEYVLKSDGTVAANGDKTVTVLPEPTLTDILNRISALEATDPVPGPQGPAGASGAQGPVGPQGPQGPAGLSDLAIEIFKATLRDNGSEFLNASPPNVLTALKYDGNGLLQANTDPTVFDSDFDGGAGPGTLTFLKGGIYMISASLTLKVDPTLVGGTFLEMRLAGQRIGQTFVPRNGGDWTTARVTARVAVASGSPATLEILGIPEDVEDITASQSTILEVTWVGVP